MAPKALYIDIARDIMYLRYDLLARIQKEKPILLYDVLYIYLLELRGCLEMDVWKLTIAN